MVVTYLLAECSASITLHNLSRDKDVCHVEILGSFYEVNSSQFELMQICDILTISQWLNDRKNRIKYSGSSLKEFAV